MPALALLALTAASVGFDFDAVGLSDLERAALRERARSEIATAGVELVDAPGLVVCVAPACGRAALASVGVEAGATVRIVKVLQLVRVELAVLDGEGAVAARFGRQLDLEGAARGPLFDEAALAALARLDAPLAATPAQPAAPSASPGDDATPPLERQPGNAGDSTLAAVALGVGGSVVALFGGALAANEALVANSATSTGEEKERSRVLGPVAVAIGVAGLAVAIGGPVLLSLGAPAQPR